MPGYVLIVDLFAVILAVIGFNMGFRQAAFRRLLGLPQLRQGGDSEDPLTYILRIAGIMLMIFGIVIGGMFTLFNLT